MANHVTQGLQVKPFSFSGRSEEQLELTNVFGTGNAHLPTYPPARTGIVLKRLVSRAAPSVVRSPRPPQVTCPRETRGLYRRESAVRPGTPPTAPTLVTASFLTQRGRMLCASWPRLRARRGPVTDSGPHFE